MRFEDFKKRLLTNPGFHKIYHLPNLKRDISLMIDEARLAKGITQEDLAEKMGTKQAAISRAESGCYLPSLSFLERMAKALDTELIAPRFAFLEEDKNYLSVDKIIKSEPLLETAKLIKYGISASESFVADAKLKL